MWLPSVWFENWGGWWSHSQDGAQVFVRKLRGQLWLCAIPEVWQTSMESCQLCGVTGQVWGSVAVKAEDIVWGVSGHPISKGWIACQRDWREATKWEGIKKSRCPRSQERSCFKEEGGVIRVECQWGTTVRFGRMGIIGNLDRRSFGGMVGTEDKLEKLKGRIRGGGMMRVIVANYVFDMVCCAENHGNRTVSGGRCLVN